AVGRAAGRVWAGLRGRLAGRGPPERAGPPDPPAAGLHHDASGVGRGLLGRVGPPIGGRNLPAMSAPPRKSSPRQPRITGSRFALVAGDLAAILLAVLLALGIWVIVDGRGLGLPFILKHLYWFPILA